MNVQPFCFVEQSDFVLRFASGVREDRRLRIDALHELVPGAPGSEELLKTLTAAAGTTWWCALRPKSQRLHLATAAEAKQYSGAAGIQRWLGAPGNAAETPGWCAAADAATGQSPTAGRWVALAAAPEAYQQGLAAFTAAGSRPAGCLAASLLTAGALAATAPETVLLLELGETTSFALAVDRGGIRGVAPISLSRGTVAEAVQAELGLKFRGAADKLFFNPDYDFGDVAAGIANRLLGVLKSEIAPLLSEFKPRVLGCVSLGARQQWLPAQLGSVLGLGPFAPDVKGWCDRTGIHFASPAIEMAAGSGWLAAFHALHEHLLAAGPARNWQSEWRAVDALTAGAAVSASPATVGTARSVAVVKSPPPPAPAKAAAPAAPAPAKTTLAATAPTIPPAPAAAAATPATSNPGATANKPMAPFPLIRPATEPARAPADRASGSSSVAYPAKPKGAAAPATPPSTEPPHAAATPPVAAAGAGARGRKLILIGVAAVVVLVLFAAVIFRSQSKAAALAAEKQKTEQRLLAEQERARLAEQKAREAAEAGGKTERELSEKLLAAEQARAEAQKEALAQAAARLANARGSATITTEPAGATVALGHLPPRPSPASFVDIKTGRYEAVITLAGYDESRLTVDVIENATAAPTPVALVRALGSLEVITQPAGVDFEIKPAHQLMVAPDARRTGKTPATFDDLAPGDYVVTLTRDGWAPRAETLNVARAGTARVNWTLPTGLLRLTSTPAGATVHRRGQQLGTTPFELKEQPAGAVEFELRRPEYDQPVVVQGEIQPGEVLELNGAFSAADRIYRAGEFDQAPEASNDKPPVLPYYLTMEKGRIEIELTVLRDGTTKAYQVRQATNHDYAKYCFDALKKWKFKPATLRGRPVNARITVPFSFKGTNG